MQTSLSGSRAVMYHDQLAATWDQRYARGGMARRAEFFKRVVLPGLPADGEWIDVGCGSGYFSRLLCERGANVLGVDGSRDMIEQARKSASKTLGKQLRFEVADVQSDLGEARFDGAICLSVLEYLETPDVCIAGVARAVRAGGTVVFSVPNRFSFVRLVQSMTRQVVRRLGFAGVEYLATSIHAWSESELRRALAVNGLRVDRVRRFDPLIPGVIARIIPASLLYVTAHRHEDDGRYR